MKTIAVIFGGRSAEHDISIITALSSIIKPLKLTGKYVIEPIYIAKDGAWYWDEAFTDISLFASGRINAFIEKAQPVQMQLDGGLTLVKTSGLRGRKSTKIDIVFPAMHGTYGEDGALMGMLEMANVAYVGSGLAASAIAMDKVLAKEVTVANDISTTPYMSLKKVSIEAGFDAHIRTIEKKLTYPLFVKPAHLGSSIGINRAVNKDELLNALEVAAHYDDTIIIEEEVKNLIEVTLPIIGNTDLTPALLESPLTNSEDFFDFDTKYLRGGKKGGKKGGTKGIHGYSQLPAKLPKALYDKAEKTALDVYRAVGCTGIARVDLLIDSKTNNVYFNEINPMPGSLYAHNWRENGMSSVELVTNLVDLAVERHEQKQHLATAFTTNFLQQF